MEGILLAAGLLAGLTSMLLLLLVVLRPVSAEVPIERRRMGEAALHSPSLLSRFSGATVRAVERNATARAGGPFGRGALQAAGVKQDPAEFLVLVGSAALAAGVLGLLLGGAGLAVLLAFLTPAGAWAFLQIRAERRRTKFEDQLPDMIMTISGSLRAGHSVLRALDGAAQEFDSPMAEELGRIVNESRVGRDAEQTMLETAVRMRSEDFSWVAGAIQINREVGGDLAVVLDQVGETIRERSQIKGQVRALSAEGKFSAYILVGLPFGISGLLFLMNPGYIGTLFSHPLGIGMLVVGGIMMAIGSFWMSRMVKIKF